LALSSACGASPGALDPSFGSGFGKVTTSIGPEHDVSRAVALQPDGRIVVAGACVNGLFSDFCVARFMPNGSLDTSFNGTGSVLTPVATGDDEAFAIALQPDGKILVAGACTSGSITDFCMVRYLPDGALDASFNGVGTVVSRISPDGSSAYAMALLPDGKIVLAGECVVGVANFCVARYSANGQLDTTFGATGTTYGAIGDASSSARAISIQSDGQILLAGKCTSGGLQRFCAMRIDRTTALFDTTFGAGGKRIVSSFTSNATVTSALLQADGKLVIGGYCSQTSHEDFCLVRLRGDGTIDTSFGTSGTAIGTPKQYSLLYAMTLQRDGKIVVAGSCQSGSEIDFCVMRFNGNGGIDGSLNTIGQMVTPVGPSVDIVRAIAVQPDGKILAAGQCYSGTFNDSAWFATRAAHLKRKFARWTLTATTVCWRPRIH